MSDSATSNEIEAERAKAPWPLPPMVSVGWLKTASRFNRSDLRAIGQAIGYQGNARRDEEFWPYFLSRFGEPDTHAQIWRLMKGEKARERAHFGYLKLKIAEILDERGEYIRRGDWRPRMPEFLAWPAIASAVESALGTVGRPDLLAGNGALVECAQLLAWSAAQIFALSDERVFGELTVEAAFLVGLSKLDRAWAPWARRCLLALDFEDWRFAKDAPLLPESGLFTDKWLEDHLEATLPGRVALLGALPEEAFAGFEPPDGDSRFDHILFRRWHDLMRIGFRIPQAVMAMSAIADDAGDRGMNDPLYSERSDLSIEEVCWRADPGSFAHLPDETVESVARAAWLCLCEDADSGNGIDEKYRAILEAAAIRLNRPELKDAVGSFEAVAEAWNEGRSEMLEEEVLESARDAWKRAIDDLRTSASGLGVEPDLARAEALVEIARRLREAAERHGVEAEEDKKRLELLISQLDAIREGARALEHEESAAVRQAIESLPTPGVYREQAVRLASDLVSVLNVLARVDHELTMALAEQDQGGDVALRKKRARAVVDAQTALERAVAGSPAITMIASLSELLQAELVPTMAAPVEQDLASSAEPDIAAVETDAGAAPDVAEASAVPSGRAIGEPKAGEAATSEPADRPAGVPPVEAAAKAAEAPPAREAVPEIHEIPEDPLAEEARRAWGILMERDEPGLAWHLTAGLDGIGRRPEDMPRPQFLEALCYGRSVSMSGDASANEMSARLAEAIKDPDGVAEAMLAMASYIRPALLAPETGAREWAMEVNAGRAVFLRRLQLTLRDVQRLSVFLTAANLRKPPAEKDLARRAAEAQGELEKWFRSATQLRLSFQRAMDVWQHLLHSKDGLIGAPVTAALGGNTEAAAAGMRAFLKNYNGYKTAIDTLIDRIDEEVNPGSTDRIIARNRHRLHTLIGEACEAFEQWLANAASREASRGDEARVASLRDEIEAAVKEAALGARDMARQSGNPFERGAAAALAESMEDILEAIQPTGKGFRERDPQGLLHDGFLRVPGQVFGGDRKPAPYDAGAVIEAILAYAVPGEKPSWLGAFSARLTEHSHIATERILRILEARGVPANELDKLAAQRDADIAQARHDLVRARGDLRRELDQALAIDAIRNATISALLEEIEAIDPKKLPIDLAQAEAASVADFPAAARVMEQVKRGLAKAFIDAAGRVSETMNALREAGKLTPEDEKKIRARLTRGDYVSASEMLELVEEGEGGFARRAQRPFHDFFPAACERIAGDEERLNRTIVAACEQGKASGPFDFSKLTEPQARSDAGRAFQDWLTLKSPQRPDKREALKGVLGAIGFRGVEIKRDGAGDRKRVVFEIEADPIINQRTCPIPRFGSMNQGHWRVSLWSGEATPEEIVSDAPKGSASGDLAIVLSRIGVDGRRKLAQAARRDSKPVIVLDECLFGWLLMQADYRLPMFFDCALPFAWCDPYPATEGPVAPESFYGRAEEIEKIIDPNGSCLVFGGRQLGKSALLAHVANLMHRPSEGCVAVRMDLKQVGADGRPETVWVAIGDELQRLGVLRGRHTSPQDLINAITRWLETDGRRRLLLMLDEMDDFLVADGERGYENVVKMRALMDTTQRRCKFVLAGLHNVQRASATANTPLVHYGEAICIGPFDRGSDKAAARRMVIDPLAAAGYEFADSWLALRILSHLNYYPSLAGVFCKQLAERMSKAAASGMRAGTEGRAGPPWLITAKDIDDTMTGEEARSKIKWRFDITLDLDPRYKLVALILALKADEDFERGIPQMPVSLADIRDEALSWWPEGFAGRAGIEAFQALLEEMQGLGVVAKAGHAGEGVGWKLRSSRIAAMIGRRTQIENELIGFKDRQPPPLKWEPGLDRARLSGRFRRSPLNRIQEGEIAGLREQADGGKDGKRAWIVFGSEAGGIEDVPEALDAIGDHMRVERFIEAPEKSDAENFGWVLKRKSVENRPRIIWVGPQYRWNDAWIAQAGQRLVTKSGIRVVFGGNSGHALAWVASGRGFGSNPTLGIATALPVLDGALRFWLKDIGYEALDSAPNLPLIEAATGGFARNLESLALEISQQAGNALPDIVGGWSARMQGEKMLGALGIDPGLRPFLEEFASQSEPLSRADMEALCELVEPKVVLGDKEVILRKEALMPWAEAMGFAFRAGGVPLAQGPMDLPPSEVVGLARKAKLHLKGFGSKSSPLAPEMSVRRDVGPVRGDRGEGGRSETGRLEAWRPNPILARLLGKAKTAAAE